MTEDECKALAKRWLVQGLTIDTTDHTGRRDHIAIKPIEIEPLAELELEALAS